MMNKTEAWRELRESIDRLVTFDLDRQKSSHDGEVRSWQESLEAESDRHGLTLAMDQALGDVVRVEFLAGVNAAQREAGRAERAAAVKKATTRKTTGARKAAAAKKTRGATKKTAAKKAAPTPRKTAAPAQGTVVDMEAAKKTRRSTKKAAKKRVVKRTAR